MVCGRYIISENIVYHQIPLSTAIVIGVVASTSVTVDDAQSTGLRIFSAAKLALAGILLTNALGESVPSRH